MTGIPRLLHPAAAAALAAAALFGASTPFAKALAGQTSPVLLAGLLYLGSGFGLDELLHHFSYTRRGSAKSLVAAAADAAAQYRRLSA